MLNDALREWERSRVPSDAEARIAELEGLLAIADRTIETLGIVSGPPSDADVEAAARAIGKVEYGLDDAVEEFRFVARAALEAVRAQDTPDGE
jgi:uncharacterized coiled-coil protein SlyX